MISHLVLILSFQKHQQSCEWANWFGHPHAAILATVMAFGRANLTCHVLTVLTTRRRGIAQVEFTILAPVVVFAEESAKGRGKARSRSEQRAEKEKRGGRREGNAENTAFVVCNPVHGSYQDFQDSMVPIAVC